MPWFTKHHKRDGPAQGGSKDGAEEPPAEDRTETEERPEREERTETEERPETEDVGMENSVVIDGKKKGASRGAEATLIEIPGAIVHLVDNEESAHLATGTFSLIRLSAHDGKGIAVFAKVGDELQWPLAKDVPTAKLDENHYFFTLRVPPEADNGEDDDKENGSDGSDVLNYGVTFASSGHDSSLAELDKYLHQYSNFSAPKIVQGAPERKAELEREMNVKGKGRLDRIEEFLFGKPDPPVRPVVMPESANVREIPASISSSPEKQKYVEEKSSAYWTTLAPNVDDYSSSMAKGIAGQSNSLVKGLFWCSDATIQQLDRLGDYAKARIKPREKPMKIHPRILRNLRRVKQMSRMSDRIAKGVLAGVVTATGLASGTVLGTRAGKKFARFLPAEVALVSLDAFGKVFDAVELAGRSVLTSTRVVTCGVVSHRYGEDAAQAAHEGLSTAGHVFSIAWTISKIRKVLNPNKGGGQFSKKALLKSAIKGRGPAAA